MLAPRYFGHFQVIEKLQLPPNSRVHPVFVVSNLKRVDHAAAVHTS